MCSLIGGDSVKSYHLILLNKVNVARSVSLVSVEYCIRAFRTVNGEILVEPVGRIIWLLHSRAQVHALQSATGVCGPYRGRVALRRQCRQEGLISEPSSPRARPLPCRRRLRVRKQPMERVRIASRGGVFSRRWCGRVIPTGTELFSLQDVSLAVPGSHSHGGWRASIERMPRRLLNKPLC